MRKMVGGGRRNEARVVFTILTSFFSVSFHSLAIALKNLLSPLELENHSIKNDTPKCILLFSPVYFTYASTCLEKTFM